MKSAIPKSTGWTTLMYHRPGFNGCCGDPSITRLSRPSGLIAASSASSLAMIGRPCRARISRSLETSSRSIRRAFVRGRYVDHERSHAPFVRGDPAGCLHAGPEFARQSWPA